MHKWARAGESEWNQSENRGNALLNAGVREQLTISHVIKQVFFDVSALQATQNTSNLFLNKGSTLHLNR